GRGARRSRAGPSPARGRGRRGCSPSPPAAARAAPNAARRSPAAPPQVRRSRRRGARRAAPCPAAGRAAAGALPPARARAPRGGGARAPRATSGTGRGPWGFSATPGATEQWWPETRRRHGGGTAAARRFPRSPAAAPGRALSCRPARPPGARPRTAAGRKRPAGREGAATPLHSPPRHARMRHPGGREPMRSYRNSDTPPPIMEGAPPPADMRVPFIDWDRPPWSRWAFQRVRQILPTAPIRRGARVSPLPAAEGSLDDFAYRRGDGTSTTFAEMLDTTYTDGMWVWKDGRVLHES